MGELGQLLELLHDAHAHVGTFACEYAEWGRQPGGNTVVVRASGARKPELRWRGAAPWAPDAHVTTRLWFKRPQRLRVEVTKADGELLRCAVRSGSEWWWWDAEHGTRSGSMLASPRDSLALPPILSPPLIEAYRLVATLRLEPAGEGERAGRRVLLARAFPRRPPATGAEPVYEFEFDSEHGSVLRRARLEGGRLVAERLAREVLYGEEIPEECFVFVPPTEDD